MQTAKNTTAKQTAATVVAATTPAPTTAPATAPTAAQTPAPTTAPVVAAPAALVWPNPQHATSYAKPAACLQSLANQGALLVRLSGPSSKLQTMLQTMAGLSAPVATLPAIVGKTAHGWAAFNVGYMGGTNASYAACAAQHGVKKAKAQPAFCYALPNGTLLTASGTPWVAPAANAPANVQAAYAQAQGAVVVVLAALAAAATPAPATVSA